MLSQFIIYSFSGSGGTGKSSAKDDVQCCIENLAPQLQRIKKAKGFLLGPNGISLKIGGTTSHSALGIKARAKLNG